MLYMLGVEKFLSKIIENMTEDERLKMIKCTTIRFMRKVQLAKPVRLSSAEIKQIIEKYVENN